MRDARCWIKKTKRRAFQWLFVLAETPYAIIGAVIVRKQNFYPNLHRRLLVDATTMCLTMVTADCPVLRQLSCIHVSPTAIPATTVSKQPVCFCSPLCYSSQPHAWPTKIHKFLGSSPWKAKFQKNWYYRASFHRPRAAEDPLSVWFSRLRQLVIGVPMLITASQSSTGKLSYRLVTGLPN